MFTVRSRTALAAAGLAATSVLALAVPSAVAAPSAATPPGGSMIPIAPVRIIDTRSYEPDGITNGRLHPTIALPNVPAADIAAVLINVTVVNARGAGYIRVGDGLGTSTGNFVSGKPSATLTLVPMTHSESDANYVPFVASASIDLVADVQGYVTTPEAASAASFTPTAPKRIADSRVPSALVPFAPNTTEFLDVRSRAALPEEATAVVANITVVKATAQTYLTAYPSTIGRPTASNINVTAGATVANRTVVPLGPDGRIALYNFAGRADVLVDVVGYLSTNPAGSVVFSFMR